MYNKKNIKEYIAQYGWSPNRKIDTAGVVELYNHYFDSYQKDDYISITFTPYPPFNKVLEFWSEYGELTINFFIEELFKGRTVRYDGEILIQKEAIENSTLYHIIDASTFYRKRFFPVAQLAIAPCFICIDEDGYFYGISYGGEVTEFSNDFLEVIDIIINNKKFPEYKCLPEYE